MARAYKKPSLCNYYCSHECPIGQEYVPEVEVKELSSIVLEMLASLNSVHKQKDRLIEIAADGKITGDEIVLFVLAMPALLGGLLLAGGVLLLIPVALVGIAFGILKAAV